MCKSVCFVARTGRVGDKVGWLPSNHLERVDPLEVARFAFCVRVSLFLAIDLPKLCWIDQNLSATGRARHRYGFAATTNRRRYSWKVEPRTMIRKLCIVFLDLASIGIKLGPRKQLMEALNDPKVKKKSRDVGSMFLVRFLQSVYNC